MKWTRYSSEEMRRKEVDDAMSSWGDSYQVPPLKPPKKTCILWSNSIVVTWWPSSICHFGGTFSHQNFERSECFMDTPLHLHPGILVLWNCRSNFLASSSSRFRVLFPQFRTRHGTCYAVHCGCGLDPHGNLVLPVTVFFMDGNAMVQSYTTVVHEFHISYSDWLVVSNMAFIFHFICGISSQPH